MPLDASPSRPLDIAVIGSGIAGMSAAWLLNKSHRITVFEKRDHAGGHANTVTVPGIDAPIDVDTGFIVYNERNYPNLVRLFRHLEVPTKASNMSFAASIDDGALEYAGSLGGLLVQKRNLLRPRYWRMLADILRFYRDGKKLLTDPAADTVTLGEYLESKGYSHAFVYNHLLPMAGAVWSTAVEDMRAHPALAFVRFCAGHGLMQVTGRPQWRTVAGGSREYVRRMTAPYAHRILVGTGVRAIERNPGGVSIIDERGRQSLFDHVVIAAHADEALSLLADATDRERALLGAFRYTRNDAVLHSDPCLMPERRKAWSSWNYLSRRGEDGRTRVCVSYWMNSLQGLDARVPLFVTLNPHREPAPDRVLRSFVYHHPHFDAVSMAAQRRLWSLQGRGNTWFCGSYFGSGFHEDALQSGLAVAERLGGVTRPWRVSASWDRIHLPTLERVTA